MPLKCAHEISDLKTLVGVTFAMIDEALKKRVLCRVTYAALCARALADDDGNNWIRAWQNHMILIEDIASDNYDNGKPLVDGLVIVDTAELTPPFRGGQFD